MWVCTIHKIIIRCLRDTRTFMCGFVEIFVIGNEGLQFSDNDS